MYPISPLSAGFRARLACALLAWPVVLLPACHRAAPQPNEARPAAPRVLPSPTAAPTAGLPDFEVKAVSTKEGEAVWYDVPAASLAQRRAWPEEMTAASDTLAPNTYVRVLRPANGKTVIVRITDHGIHRRGTLIDVDRAAGEALDMIKAGTAHVKIEVLALKNADAKGPPPKEDVAKEPGATAADEKAAALRKSGGEAKP